MVVFRPRWDELRETLESLSRCKREFRQVRMLVSGTNAEHAQLLHELEQLDMCGQAAITHRYDNLGFAAGHNLLLRDAFDDGAASCLVLNPDMVVGERAIAKLRDFAWETPGTALIGPVLRSAVEPGKIDSMGLEWTRSGRHQDKAQGTAESSPTGQISFPPGLTGACLLVTAKTFVTITERTGHFFDDYFLAYREDAELGVRAWAVGVPSVLLDIDGFAHGRAVKGFERGNRHIDLLGVRNRFFLRWKLGRSRPGSYGLPSLRDLAVIFACLTVERTSAPGLREAFRIRRSVRNRGRQFRLLAPKNSVTAARERET